MGFDSASEQVSASLTNSSLAARLDVAVSNANQENSPKWSGPPGEHAPEVPGDLSRAAFGAHGYLRAPSNE
jgi:hypothetical protein